VGIRHGQDERAAAAHFLVQEADGVALGVVRAQRIRTDQFGQAIGDMGFGAAERPHFVENGRHAGAGQLPNGLGAG